MAEILRVNGTREPVAPEGGSPVFELRQLQRIVGGYIEIQPLRVTGGWLVLHEDGKGVGLPVNAAATALWLANGGQDPIVGDVLICARGQLEE
jgi:hypothetical protein